MVGRARNIEFSRLEEGWRDSVVENIGKRNLLREDLLPVKKKRCIGN